MAITLDFDNRSDLEYFADVVADRLAAKLAAPKPSHITFAEAMQELGIRNNALTRRLEAAGIRTYRHGRGKAFDRKHLPKLR